MRTKISVLLTIAGLVGSVLPAQAQLVVNQLDGTTLTPTDLVNLLIAPSSGISDISNITFAGGDVQGGTYTGGLSAGLSNNSGVVLSSGDINTLPLPLGDTGSGASNNIGTPGNSLLDDLVTPLSTNDAAVLTFDFIPDGDNITFEYQFGSTEYNFFVNSSFNDVFGFFVNGVDFAVIPGTTTPITINTVNCGQSSGGTSITSPGNPPITNCELFENNRNSDGLTGSSKAVNLGGFVQTLSFLAPVNRGVVNTITIAIADTSDSSLDSAVFIQEGTLQVCGGNGQPPCPSPKVPEPSSLAMIGLGAITLGLMRRRKSS